MNSMVEYEELTKDNFESCICNYASRETILLIFDKTEEEMNTWCRENYGKLFKQTYERLKEIAKLEFVGLMNRLSIRGNSTAISVVREEASGRKEDGTVKLEFVNNIKVETEDDRKN